MSSVVDRATSALVISGSARDDGNTAQVVRHLCDVLGESAVHIDLAALRVDPFRYGGEPADDDFGRLIELMLRHRDIVFATPVYWYAMSGILKTFFDRLTDLLVDEKSRRIGRGLAGRDVWLVATGTDEDLPPGFEQPFVLTAAYFGMRWQRAIYVRSIGGGRPDAPALSGVQQLGVELREKV